MDPNSPSLVPQPKKINNYHNHNSRCHHLPGLSVSAFGVRGEGEGLQSYEALVWTTPPPTNSSRPSSTSRPTGEWHKQRTTTVSNSPLVTAVRHRRDSLPRNGSDAIRHLFGNEKPASLCLSFTPNFGEYRTAMTGCSCKNIIRNLFEISLSLIMTLLHTFGQSCGFC